jgi:ABC-type nitrate/sulfonate/bicarbonate transport system substrate-binding protein
MQSITQASRLPRRARVGLVAGVVAAALTLSACAGTDTASPETDSFGDLSVQLSWIKNAEFAGEFFADSNGYYTDAGFDSVNLVAGPGATESLVASGESLIGITDPISVAPAIVNEGAPLKIIATTYQKNPFSILSLADGANIATPADLVGKRIGVQAGNETLFNALLDVNGIAPEDVTVVPVEYDPSPLITGDVDGSSPTSPTSRSSSSRRATTSPTCSTPTTASSS